MLLEKNNRKQQDVKDLIRYNSLCFIPLIYCHNCLVRLYKLRFWDKERKRSNKVISWRSNQLSARLLARLARRKALSARISLRAPRAEFLSVFLLLLGRNFSFARFVFKSCSRIQLKCTFKGILSENLELSVWLTEFCGHRS